MAMRDGVELEEYGVQVRPAARARGGGHQACESSRATFLTERGSLVSSLLHTGVYGRLL
jgi:hypothetical protein